MYARNSPSFADIVHIDKKTYLNPITRGTPNLGIWGCCGRGCPWPWGWDRRAWSRPWSIRYHGRPTAKWRSVPSSSPSPWGCCSSPITGGGGGLLCWRCLLEGGSVSSLLSVWSSSEGLWSVYVSVYKWKRDKGRCEVGMRWKYFMSNVAMAWLVVKGFLPNDFTYQQTYLANDLILWSNPPQSLILFRVMKLSHGTSIYIYAEACGCAPLLTVHIGHA